MNTTDVNTTKAQTIANKIRHLPSLLLPKNIISQSHQHNDHTLFNSRTIDIQQKLHLTNRETNQKFFSVFQSYDHDDEGCLSIETVYRYLLHVEKGADEFGNVIFGLFVANVEKMEFQDLFYAIGSFVMFELEEMVKLMFYKMDPEKNGYLFEEQVVSYMKLLHGEGGIYKKNMRIALKALRFKRDGTTTFHECCSWCRLFPCILEPCFCIQDKLRQRFKIRKMLDRKKDRERTTMETKEQERANEERRLVKERQRRIKSELGLQYYFDKRKREHMESLYPKPVVYLSDDLEIKIRMEE